MMGKIAS